MKQLLVIITLALSSSLIGQQKEVLIPFSKPGESKELNIQLFNGDIRIIGTNRDDVLIKYQVEKQDEDHNNQKDDDSRGMKKIGGGNFQFEVGERNNRAYIQSQNFMNLIRMEIEVPSNIDIDISKQIGEDVMIENVVGNINVENNVGSVTILNVSGSVNASSSTGEIKVEFNEINSEQSMAFNTITGSIDLTFPKTYKADLKMRTEWGDIYSDMEIVTKAMEDPERKTFKDGGLKVISNNWTYGSLNGGGPEMTLKTQMGSIYLRAKE